MKKEDVLKIIQHYGIDSQLRKFTEEYFELVEAIINAENNRLIGVSRKPSELAIKHIAEELSDCMVLLEQFKLYYDISSEEITEIFWSKVNRQLDRIKKENK
jgi:NTP pyrophosphatase (non-canonical NTP hydrolase)